MADSPLKRWNPKDSVMTPLKKQQENNNQTWILFQARIFLKYEGKK